MCCISADECHKRKNRVTEGGFWIQILLELYLGHQPIHLVAQRDQWGEMSMRPCRKSRSKVTSNTLEWVELLTLPLTQRARGGERENGEKNRAMEKKSKVKNQSAIVASMNSDAKHSMELYTEPKNKQKSVLTYFQTSHHFSVGFYLLSRTKSAQTGFSKNSRRVQGLCQAVLYKQFHYSKI